MALVDHIRACDRHDLGAFTPIVIEHVAVGWVRPTLADAIVAANLGLDFDAAGRLTFPKCVDEPVARTQALEKVARWLVMDGVIPGLRHERYPVLTRWGTPPLAEIDRAAVVALGFRAFGVHLNGYVRRPDGGLSLWLGRRARDRAIEPGKLDNLVAGGQPCGLSPRENLIKEGWEEAGMSAEMVGRARPVGAIRYALETAQGLKPDTLFTFDLELSADFTPTNTDGEVEAFELWPVERVLESLRDGTDWKFNVTLVVIDFLIRHGVLTPDSEPDYVELACGPRGLAD